MSALLVHFGDGLLIFGVAAAPLHPDDHDRPRQSATDGPFSTNPSAKTGCQLRENRTFISKILLETQGDRFGSVESLPKIAPCLAGHLLSTFCHFDLSPFVTLWALTDKLEEVNLRRRAFCGLLRALSGAHVPGQE